MNKTLTRIATGVATAALAGGLALTTATPASAASTAYRLYDPVVRMYQPCPSSYVKGIVNVNRYKLAYKGDTASRCRYDVYSLSGYYAGYSHTFSKVY